MLFSLHQELFKSMLVAVDFPSDSDIPVLDVKLIRIHRLFKNILAVLREIENHF